MAKRTCHVCKKTLVEIPRTPQQGQQHCASANCHWCMTCERRRLAEAKNAP
ncbi:hypothetical protein SAMN05892883_2082 [Jatrophihabitans sp. GAS493]|nr:hypothetical protein SAMN05892883_2082 [Jatrophihabitans sp. GAS493]